ncbi:small ribosomal subunit protein mS27-like [Ptychodera flava]|uniref:small ribosomal subunit protein mS27-like n=1 Tax=Ptychodera flava TaxID=63121 RepID=UPI00396A37FC
MAAHLCRRATSNARQLCTLRTFTVQKIRTLLSDAYYCNAAWDQRNKLTTSLGELTKKIESKFTMKEAIKHPVSSIDIDTYVNNVETKDQLDQAKEFLYRYRHSPVAFYLRDFTVHAWIRTCLKLGVVDEAFSTVQNKVHYGLFPDNYSFNLILDTYIKEGDIQKAMSVAIEMMQQEVLRAEEDLSQLLALHTCHQYLNSNDDIEDEMKKQIGMTLIDSTRGQDHIVSMTYHLIGLAMSGDIEKTVKRLSKLLESENLPCVLQEAVDSLRKAYLNKDEIQEQEEDDGVIIYDVQAEQELENKLQALLDHLEKDCLSDGKLNDLAEVYITSQLSDLEKPHIESYPGFLEDRYQDAKRGLEKQIASREARIAEVKAKEREIWKLMISKPGEDMPSPPTLTEEDKRIISKQEKYIYED